MLSAFFYGIILGIPNNAILAIFFVILIILGFVLGTSVMASFVSVGYSSHSEISTLKGALVHMVLAMGIVGIVAIVLAAIYLLFIAPFFSLFVIGVSGIVNRGWGVFEALGKSFLSFSPYFAAFVASGIIVGIIVALLNGLIASYLLLFAYVYVYMYVLPLAENK